MSEASDIERLKKTPIVELDLGEAKLRRVVIRAGFESLVDVLELSEKEIDEKFEWHEADKIISMQEKYRKDPEGFAASVLNKRVIDQRQIEQRLQKHTTQNNETPKRRAATIAIPRAYYSGDGPRSLPPMPFPIPCENTKDARGRCLTTLMIAAMTSWSIRRLMKSPLSLMKYPMRSALYSATTLISHEPRLG